MKNKILTIMILTMLALPVSVQAVPEVETFQQEEIVTPAVPYKQPISKKKIAKKFLLAMGGVATSSLIIFLILTVYNKLRAGFSNGIKTPDGESSLATPNDLQGAVRAFLNKTDWK